MGGSQTTASSGSGTSQDNSGTTSQGSSSTTTPHIPTLVWQAPYTREDGTSLAPNEIGEYRVYYKPIGAKTYQEIDLTDTSITDLPLSGFASGGYDFYVTAVDTNGLESPPSSTVEVNI